MSRAGKDGQQLDNAYEFITFSPDVEDF